MIRMAQADIDRFTGNVSRAADALDSFMRLAQAHDFESAARAIGCVIRA